MKQINVTLNRPVILSRGWKGQIVSNQTSAYIGEWVSFYFPVSDDSTAQLLLPLDEAIENGLIIDPNEYEDEDE